MNITLTDLKKLADDLTNVTYSIIGHPTRQEAQFHDALRARTPQVVATLALAALNAAVFILMVLGSGPLGDPETIVRWGGNFGPRTTNWEWWRLVTALFVHSSLIHLLVNIAGLVQAGQIVERLVGPRAFTTTYFVAGILPGLLGISDQPVGVTAGAGPAVFGIYGLLGASFVVGLRHRSPVTIPLPALKRLAPAAGIFLLYNVVAGGPFVSGLVLGFVCGIALAFGAGDQNPTPRRIAQIAGAAAVVAVVAAVPLHGIADIRPEIARIAALHEHTTSGYDAAAARFRKGRISADALAKHIDREILPNLTAAHERVLALRGVPRQHQPLVAAAEEYLRLHVVSFRLRADGLRKSSMPKLQQAERTEGDARAALEKIKALDPSGG
jgi:membrane associated rhomboid family serine protease